MAKVHPFQLFALTLVFLEALSGCGSTQAPASLTFGEPLELSSGESVPEAFSGSASEDNDSKTSIEETNMSQDPSSVPVTPGTHTLENFLATALLPVGETMYIWGGGWNEEDTGAGEEACSIGVSPNWKAFAAAQTADYDYQETRYMIHDGLDCSGYVGWTVYNVMESEDGKEGYVLKSTDTAKTYASYGWGDYLSSDQVADWLPGDIASMKGHVWICLGTCEDGSVLLVHSSPPGVRLCGTQASGDTSEAVTLANQFMSAHCPDWFARYPECSVDPSYIRNSGQLRWNTETFPDAEELRALTPAALLEYLGVPVQTDSP